MGCREPGREAAREVDGTRGTRGREKGTPRARLSARRLACAAGFFLLSALAPHGARAQQISPDVTVDLEGTLAADEDVVDATGSEPPSPVGLGALPDVSDVIAYTPLPGEGALFALSTTTDLGEGIVARPLDVLRWDGLAYALELRGSDHGIPAGARIDALAREGSDLLLSFDVTVELGGLIAGDEDLVRLERSADGTAAWSLAFDGSEAGLPDAVDLDGADRPGRSGVLALSFDTSGRVDGLTFHDEDILEFDSALGTWSLRFEGATRLPGLAAADVDAVTVPEPGGPAGVVAALWAVSGLGARRRRAARKRP